MRHVSAIQTITKEQDTEGNIQCTLCPDESTRHIDSADQSIIGCGMFSRITILIVTHSNSYLL